jgi:hypothetical protein
MKDKIKFNNLLKLYTFFNLFYYKNYVKYDNFIAQIN